MSGDDVAARYAEATANAMSALMGMIHAFREGGRSREFTRQYVLDINAGSFDDFALNLFEEMWPDE